MLVYMYMGKEDKKQAEKEAIHRILTYSYAFFFLFLLAGFVLDFVFPLQMKETSLLHPVGLLFLAFGTFFVLWAQKTTRTFKKDNITKDNFYRGPYKYTRGPTHWGLFFLILGLGMISNAFFVILFAFVAFLFSRFTFLVKQESLLAKKYGIPYAEYKKIVKF